MESRSSGRYGRVSRVLVGMVCVILLLSIPLGALGWTWPVTGWKITRKKPFHSGHYLDFGAKIGTPIKATAAGTVLCSTNKDLSKMCPTCYLMPQTVGGKFYTTGIHVVINHGKGQYSYYAHLSKAAVRSKDKVKEGQVIGYVGNTGYSLGAHLHFGIGVFEKGKRWTTPYNPMTLITPFSRVEVSKLTETSASISGDVANYGHVSGAGFYFGTSPDTLTRKYQKAPADLRGISYDTEKWVGKLSPGTTYYYKLYVIFDGKEYTSALLKFTTPSSTTQVPVSGVTVSAAAQSLRVGEQLQFSAQITPETATDPTLRWYSSNEIVATIDQKGLVTALRPGTTEISAHAQDGSWVKGSLSLTVTEPVMVTQILLDPTVFGVELGDSLQLTAAIEPANADERDLVWASSDPDYVSVDQSGLVTAVKAGRRGNITATAKDGSGVWGFAGFTVILRGDATLDGLINIEDLSCIIDYLAGGVVCPSMEGADADASCGDPDLADLAWIINKIIP